MIIWGGILMLCQENLSKSVIRPWPSAKWSGGKKTKLLLPLITLRPDAMCICLCPSYCQITIPPTAIWACSVATLIYAHPWHPTINTFITGKRPGKQDQPMQCTWHVEGRRVAWVKKAKCCILTIFAGWALMSPTVGATSWDKKAAESTTTDRTS